MKYQLVSPTLVPIGLLELLESVGLDTTEKVHRAIEENALQSYKGIGPARERKILHYYTTPPNPQRTLEVHSEKGKE